jgi:hypothetical protein
MNREEQIRAKALELAMLSYGKEQIDGVWKREEINTAPVFPERLRQRTELIADYISPGENAARK